MDPNQQTPFNQVGSGFLALWLYRRARWATYTLIGMFRPGWRNAKPILRQIEELSDRGTMNLPIYSDPAFGWELRKLETKLKQTRRGR